MGQSGRYDQKGKGIVEAVVSWLVSRGEVSRRPPPKRRGGRSALKIERKKNAEEQIRRLIHMATKEINEEPTLASRHAQIAWNIATRHNVRLKENRILFCHNCKSFIASSRYSRIRLGRGRIIRITCLKCGKTFRHSIRKA